MKHLGDITKISGYTAPIVDCIIGGSPCQDLSVAGKRAGLDGERSGLFMEQVRIVKEMRNRERLNGKSGVDIRPRYMVWENVPGALSSGKPKGEDFRIVLEEIAKVADKDAVIPGPPKGKWQNSGCILGDGWSIAWRVLDAQFWGVPQRRRRIALVADFGGETAPEILFVRKSVSGDIEPGEPKGKEASSDASGGVGADGCIGTKNVILFEPRSQDGVPRIHNDISPTLNTAQGGQRQPCICFPQQAYDKYIEDNTGTTLKAMGGSYGGGSENLVVACAGTAVEPAVCYSTNHGTFHTQVEEGICATLQATDYKDPPTVTYCIGNGQAHDAQRLDKELCKTLNCMGNPMGICITGTRYIVRRLTPLECERLQGFPDNWTRIGEVVGYERQIDERTGEEYVQAIYEYIDANGKKRKTSDAARYKALGNSISIPNWKWVLKKLCACYERDATMASLFDGIGGFPYIWEQFNGKGSCLWASEIEEFPIAVTKVRFGD